MNESLEPNLACSGIVGYQHRRFVTVLYEGEWTVETKSREREAADVGN